MTWYREINPVQEPQASVMDETKKRVLYQFNIDVVKCPSTTLLKELAQRIHAEGAGVRGTNIFISPKAVIPTDAGPYIVLKSTGGTGPAWIHNSDTPNMQNPSVQISVIAESDDVANASAYAVYDALVGVKNIDLLAS